LNEKLLKERPALEQALDEALAGVKPRKTLSLKLCATQATRAPL
jgi:hypothetical protein